MSGTGGDLIRLADATTVAGVIGAPQSQFGDGAEICRTDPSDTRQGSA